MKKNKQIFYLQILFIIFLFSCISQKYSILSKNEEINIGILNSDCNIINNATGDTIKIYTFSSFIDNNYYILNEFLYIFYRHYVFESDPPYNEVILSKFSLKEKSYEFEKKYNFGIYNDPVKSEFKSNILTIMRADSIIKFDIEKFEIIETFKVE